MASTTWGNPPVDPPAGATALRIGLYSGKGKNVTFTETSTFTAGDDVTILAQVDDENGQPVTGATVTIAITGPESATLTSISDSTGQAELSWNTQAPNKRGNGGTTLGAYRATTADATATGYAWDGIANSAAFTLQ